jgi:hypothetical protein
MAGVESTILVAKVPFDYDGLHVAAGTTVRAGHPILGGGREQFFVPLVVDHEYEPPAGRHGARAKTVADK